MPERHAATGLALSLSLMISAGAAAQEPPPIGIAPLELSDEPYVFDTAEQHGIEVTVIAKDFARPFALDFLPNGDLLVTERGGNLRIITAATSDAAVLLPGPIAGMPEQTTVQGNFWLHDIFVHPDFAENGLIYWTWNVAVPNTENPDEPPAQARFAIMRGVLSANGMSKVETIFATDEPSYSGGTRVVIDGDGMVFATTSAPFGPQGQDITSPYGKVLRLNGDGSIPADNPFLGEEGAHPAIYSLGHRDQHGLLAHPDGHVFSVEHGPNGGDELNLIAPGANYGWPAVTLGRNYDGTAMGVPMQAEGITDPLVAWLPSIAPSGLMVYTGDAFPEWQGNIFVGSGRWGEINNTGSLQRIVFNEEFGELRREALLQQLHHRVRDVAQGPDGLIYVLTDGPEHSVLRIAPAQLP